MDLQLPVEICFMDNCLRDSKEHQDSWSTEWEFMGYDFDMEKK
jgi:hypothetical protein